MTAPRYSRSAAKGGKLLSMSFIEFLAATDYCALDLTPHMAAVAVASEGGDVSEYLDDVQCKAIFGCTASNLPREPRRTVIVQGGGGGGKSSRLAATKALHAAVTVPCPNLRSGERARVVIIAPTRDMAEQTLDFARGYVDDSPELTRMLVAEDSGKTRIRLRRGDGREVDIVVGAATRGARSVRVRRFVAVIIEEACFFDLEEGAAVSDREIYRAATLRVLPGGQIWMVSTPWIEDKGLMEEKIGQETITVGPRAGERKHANALVVTRLSTRMMNPSWDEDGSIEADMRATDPENADREILAIPLSSDTSAFFDPESIKRAFDMPPLEGTARGVGIGGDLGLVGDCTAGAATQVYELVGGGEGYDTFDAFERRPARGSPLKPSEVCDEAARFAADRGADAICADGHYRESLREYAEPHGVSVVPAPDKEASYFAFRRVMAEGRWRCSIPDPTVRRRCREQLRSITKRPRAKGGWDISAPRMKASPTGASGGHGDIASAVVLSAWRCGAGRATGTKTLPLEGVGETRRGSIRTRRINRRRELEELRERAAQEENDGARDRC